MSANGGVDKMLTPRQQMILHLIIQNYTNTGQPTGSKRLMEDGVEASSATIRNEMKALEEAGLLLKHIHLQGVCHQ